VRARGLVQGWPFGDALFTWCEPDTWTPAAEFHNTLSNIPYCIVGAITIHTGSQHPSLAPLRMVGLMLVAIGVGSMLFHGTLTRVGQAADELAILWWEVSMLLLLYPSRSTAIWSLFAFENSVYWLMDFYPKVGWLL
jgi:alkaline ceramidase